MVSTLENFKKLNELLLKEKRLNFFEENPPSPVDVLDIKEDCIIKNGREKIHINKFKEQIDEASEYFKDDRYKSGYVAPLKKNVQDIILALRPYPTPPDPERMQKYVFLTLLINAALQPAKKEAAKYVCAAQAIANELYGNFLKARARHRLKAPLDHQCPPLVGFVAAPLFFETRQISDQAPMPATLELGMLCDSNWVEKKYVKNFTAGAVLLPAGYRDAPLLWGALGHEVGGHYVLTADRDDKLLEELQNGVYELLKDKYSREVTALWHFWTEEAAADVCGVLNLGPSFAIGAIAWYTAVRCQGNWGGEEELNSDWLPGDMHPIPALIPSLLSGAVTGLKEFGPTQKQDGVSQLEEIGKQFFTNQNNVLFPDRSTVDDPENRAKPIKLPGAIPLKEMQDSGRLVGEYIATAKLTALGGRCLQDLATWTDDEEAAAIEVADRLRKRATDIPMDRSKVQLLSGGLLAVIREPEVYEHVNQVLLNAFGCR